MRKWKEYESEFSPVVSGLDFRIKRVCFHSSSCFFYRADVKKLVTPESIKAAYELLRVTTFRDVHVRPAEKVKFVAKKLKKYHGLYYWPEHKMEIDTQTPTATKLLQTVAHEMTHSVLDHHGNEDHPLHDSTFQKVADIICSDMGWPKGSV